jgi:protein-S-isoprenylcysteine O-methyltransferase Ste14
MKPVNLIILIAGTLLLIYFSWVASIREKRYHGIYRFFAFESIFLLVLMNYPEWFKHVFAVNQIISWILLLGSLIFAIWGFVLLYRMGKPAEGHLERTTRLITTGLYGYIRHPLYLSLILGGFGAMAKDPGYLQILLAIINFIALIFTARVEEQEMIMKFGEEYREYKKQTKMFIPYIL